MAESGRLDGKFSLSDLTPDYIRDNYFLGIEPLVDGEPVKEEFWKKWIRTSLMHIQKEAQIAIARQEIIREPHDYWVQDYQNFAFIQLFNRPLIKVREVKAVYPTGATVFEFPPEWIRAHIEGGQIQIVPTQGTLSQVLLGRGGGNLPLLIQTLGYLPEFFQVDYEAGFPEGQLPEDIVDAIGKRVAIEVFAQLGDLVYGPGVTSVSTSIDGVSQSLSIVNNGQLGAVFTSRIAQYRLDLYGDPKAKDDSGQPGLIKRLKSQYHGVNAWTM